jgi:hypothetical protein
MLGVVGNKTQVLFTVVRTFTTLSPFILVAYDTPHTFIAL